MKATKKIVGAACALVAAVALSAGSTFAWFANNTKVEASGMNVKATTTSNLYIANGIVDSADSITATSVTLNSEAKTLNPAKLDQKLGSADAKEGVTVSYPATWTTPPTPSSAGTPATYTEAGTITKTTSDFSATASYCVAEHVSIIRKTQTGSAGTYTLTAEATVTLGANSNINKAFYIGLLVNNVWYAGTDANTATGTATFSFTLASDYADNTIYDAVIVAYFDGNDSDCVSDNNLVVSSNSVKVQFTAA